jgi:hypothetical protein
MKDSGLDDRIADECRRANKTAGRTWGKPCVPALQKWEQASACAFSFQSKKFFQDEP